MPAGQEPPTGVVTFVLTDVVGSTELWDSASAEMAVALDLHNGVVAETVERHGGVLLKPRGEGDSTFSVFERPSDAVRAAYEIQIGLDGQAWPPAARLRVRIGVHTGEATYQDGDYLGTTVNRAARLRGVAEGGEVLVSASVAHVVADHLPLDTALAPLGQVALRGLERHEEVFALTGPGLTAPSATPRGLPQADLLAEKGVTKRERDVLDALSERLTNAEIAGRFSVSERTVETHVSSLLRKLHATNRRELAELARATGSSGAAELPPMLLRSAQRSACVGRRAERVGLLDAWDRCATGQTGLVVVTGAAGIGKSRLVAELAVDVHRRSGRVLLGAATDGAQLAYQPFVDALASVVEHAPEGQLRADVGTNTAPLARILPSVAARLGALPPSSGIDPLGERESSQAALASFAAAVARRHPTLLVLEDLHWASALTRAAVLHLARTGGTAPLLVVVTTRDTVPELDAALTSWLSDAARLPVCEVVALGGLDLEETTAFLADIGGSVDPSTALHATGGNPLFLREVATAGTTSPTLQDFLADRYARLSDEDLHLVDLAAVVGESFRVDVIAAAAERPVDDVFDALERITDAGLIEEVAGQPGQCAFAHALYRDARYDAITAGRRLRLHAAVTRALVPRAADPAVLPELAVHACASAPIGDPDQAADLAKQAGHLSLTLCDYAGAVGHFQRALDVIDLVAVPDEHRRLDLTIRLGEATAPLAPTDGRAILRDATRQARRLGDARSFADAVCAMQIDMGSVSPSRDDPVVRGLAEEALALLDDDETHWRARLLAVLGGLLGLGTEPDLGRRLAQEAVAVARRGDDPMDVVRTVLTQFYVLDQLDYAEELHALIEAREIAERQGDVHVAQLAASRTAVVHRALGDFEAMWPFHRMAYETSEPGVGELQAKCLLTLLAGDLDSATAQLDEIREAAARFDVVPLYFGSVLVLVRLWRDEPTARLIEPFANGGSFMSSGARALLAFSRLAEHDIEGAAASLEEIRATGFSSLPPGMTRVFSLAIWGDAAAALGDRGSCEEILGLLDPAAGCLADAAGGTWSSIDQVRAQLLLSLGDAKRAEPVAAEAVAASRRRGTRLFLGRELIVLAAARQALDRDRDQIAPLVDEALAIADATGAALIRADAVRHGLT